MPKVAEHKTNIVKSHADGSMSGMTECMSAACSCEHCKRKSKHNSG